MKNIYRKLAEAVVKMDSTGVKNLSEKILHEGYSPRDAIEQGLAAGMIEVGKLFERKEYYVPEVLVCSRAMYAGFDILKPKVLESTLPNKGKIVLGVVEGDFHDIGKNIVKLLLEATGFQIVDLGKNVRIQTFIDTIESETPDILALSTLMTTTMENMEYIVKEVLSLFPAVKIMLGGAPVTEDFAVNIKAHYYGEDAHRAVTGAHKLLDLNYEG